jgi:TPR repeat
MTDQGNSFFRKGDYVAAIKHYTVAHEIEPELPHYQLNLAASYIKLNEYVQSHVSLLLRSWSLHGKVSVGSQLRRPVTLL